ncbi:hypothetical protein CEXT_723571 [Caerostris extrusa]|uniref:Uncharacterized protein n=1 Tax=Caerostris extrusa TaxID=172846 RepID=A0AAV4M3W4_CAEEX|nr:hypothetical protein CEXT_723571 [Caerostris extrusa]
MSRQRRERGRPGVAGAVDPLRNAGKFFVSQDTRTIQDRKKNVFYLKDWSLPKEEKKRKKVCSGNHLESGTFCKTLKCIFRSHVTPEERKRGRPGVAGAVDPQECSQDTRTMEGRKTNRRDGQCFGTLERIVFSVR